jgi:hypothetical protein
LAEVIPYGDFLFMKNTKCNKCQIEKSQDNFYKSNRRVCITCIRKQQKATRENPLNYERYLEIDRQKKANKLTKQVITTEQKKILKERYYSKYPEKKAAHIVAQRIKRSRIGTVWHHWSYKEEHRKEVIELSHLDHKKLHRSLIYDPIEMIYQTKSGISLCTKELHYTYMKEILNDIYWN